MSVIGYVFYFIKLIIHSIETFSINYPLITNNCNEHTFVLFNLLVLQNLTFNKPYVSIITIPKDEGEFEMKIKEIRDFKKLSLVEKREQLKKTRQILNFARIVQYGSIVGTVICVPDLINDLKNGGLVSEGPSFYSFSMLLMLCAAIYLKSQKYPEFIQQETIINLEENELTRERTLN